MQLITWLKGAWKPLLPYFLLGGMALWGWHLVQQDAVDRAAVNTEIARFRKAEKEQQEARLALVRQLEEIQRERDRLANEKHMLEASNQLLRKQNEKLYRDYRAVAGMLPVRPDF